MLSIDHQTVPLSETLYIAFRLAFLETLERIALAEQIGVGDRSFGYLTQVPFLRNTRPAVQLDELLVTWSRHQACEIHESTLVDQSVLYAACETAVQVVRTDPMSARRILNSGPVPCRVDVNGALADRLQQAHLSCTRKGDFLLLSQFQDIPPAEAATLKREYGIDDETTECMFELLSRYRVSPLMAERARGLLTPNEIRQVFGTLRLAAAAT